jgi:cellulose synthase/poly-beta-1,6-N-acetylglucosamine synthase-like glycosyltransferase
VVIPTIAVRIDELFGCCRALGAQSYPDFEIIVVDNRPGDVAGPDLAELSELPRTRVVREPTPGISAARNKGIAIAHGEIVAFTDDDVQPGHDWLRAIGRRFASEPELDGVTGLILPAELDTASQVWFERFYGGFGGQRTFEPLTLHAARSTGFLNAARVAATDPAGNERRRFAVYGIGGYGAGANMAFRASTVSGLGGFDLALGVGTPARGGEDLAILVSILWQGGRIGFEPSAVVYHRHRRLYAELRHQLIGNGVGFTAMLASLIADDRRHLLSLAAQVPVAVKKMALQRLPKLRSGSREPAPAHTTQRHYPRKLLLWELSGYPRGPLAYRRSRRRSN